MEHGWRDGSCKQGRIPLVEEQSTAAYARNAKAAQPEEAEEADEAEEGGGSGGEVAAERRKGVKPRSPQR